VAGRNSAVGYFSGRRTLHPTLHPDLVGSPSIFGPYWLMEFRIPIHKEKQKSATIHRMPSTVRNASSDEEVEPVNQHRLADNLEDRYINLTLLNHGDPISAICFPYSPIQKEASRDCRLHWLSFFIPNHNRKHDACRWSVFSLVINRVQ